MPQSTPYYRYKMIKWFGDIDTIGPQTFLESHGYTLNNTWQWIKPVPSHTVSEDEAMCIEFLIMEWDYGGILE